MVETARNALDDHSQRGAIQNSLEAFYVPPGDEVGRGSRLVDASRILVSAQVTVPTFLARATGFDDASTGTIAGGGFPPLDIMLVMDHCGMMVDDCSEPRRLLGDGCGLRS
jgi:hypothetical protein